MPQCLDEAGLEVANIGLSNAVREALQLADMASLMLNQVLQLFEKPDQAAFDKVRQLDHSVDLLSAAIRAYLADIGQEGLSDDDADRATGNPHVRDQPGACEDILSTWRNWRFAGPTWRTFLDL